MHLVMFDVDGTLADSNGFDGELFAQAVREIIGVELDQTWQSYRHITDTGVLTEILARNEMSDERLIGTVKERFVSLVREYLGDTADPIEEIRGAAALVSRLASTDGISLAIATGGWRETAELKLATAGIDVSGIPIPTSSDAMERIRIMELAEERATGGSPFAKRTYFGDANWDQRACAELGYSFVAVGNAVENPVRFENLTDQESILSALGK